NFGLKEKMSGVGFSFGVDRLYDVLEELELFPEDSLQSTKILLTHFDQKAFIYALGLLKKFRAAGIKAELYPDVTKMKKQLDFASKKAIPFVGICGDAEIEANVIALKNLDTGEQQSVSLGDAIARLK
ncbi:MAG: His/Gly/Thr/Pro-type tRNA ligase C-terminal domain-containing protein, partial [Algoriphagus sp.]